MHRSIVLSLLTAAASVVSACKDVPDAVTQPAAGLAASASSDNEGAVHFAGFTDHLPWLVIPGREGGAQRFMSPDDFIQCSVHRINLQVTTQSHRDGNVVERAARLQLMKKPETLLREGKRQVLVPIDSLDPCQCYARFEL